MNRFIPVAWLGLLVGLACNLTAGERVAFIPGAEIGGEQVLGHLRLKSVITEFLDPQDTGLGKSLGYLVWRETLAAISDQRGAGVILAHPPGDQRIVEMLRQDYHQAALEIAKYEEAPIALWGRITREQGQLIIDTACTLLPEINQSVLKVRLAAGNPQAAADDPLTLQAVIPRSRFSFAWVETTRDKLFERSLVSGYEGAVLRAEPAENARSLAWLPANRGLQAVDMQGAWFKIRQTDGSHAYVHAASVMLPPREVAATGLRVKFHTKPTKDSTKLKELRLSGLYRVLDSRYLRKGVWYRIKAGETAGWVEGWRVTPRFSLPAVHFLAGLFRYFAQNYAVAEQEFGQFIERAGANTRNRVMATAYQLRAASRLMKAKHAFSADKDAVLADLEKASRLTPYDPSSYNLQVIAQLGAYPDAAKAIAALQRALDLDAEDPSALGLVVSLKKITERSGQTQYRNLLRFSSEEKLKIQSLTLP
ncbi:MAG: SH3 domain-containing protein [Gammaproteobacteria bacterium]|nr:SH3 domain-containing protein [Gammaproteobacteria bacterium]